LPLVDDCAVLARSGKEGARWVAYVASRGPLSHGRIDAHLREAAPAMRRPDHVVLVTRLPLTASGTLDESALSTIPVVDEDLASRAEGLLSGHPGVEHAAVFLDREPRPLALLHERQILPREVASASPLVESARDADKESGSDAREDGGGPAATSEG